MPDPDTKFKPLWIDRPGAKALLEKRNCEGRLSPEVNSKRAHKAIYADKIDRVLQEVFKAPANAFQCLTFSHGSQQSMHQDVAYVVVSEPLQFMASWVALENVTPGAGELMYFSGSNHLDDFLFPDDSKSWNPGKHGQRIHYEFLDSIVFRSKAADMPHETFLPKNGYISSRHYDLRPQYAPVKKDRFDTVRLTPLFMGQQNENT